jgi:hypothetical protein
MLFKYAPTLGIIACCRHQDVCFGEVTTSFVVVLGISADNPCSRFLDMQLARTGVDFYAYLLPMTKAKTY